MLYNWFTIFLTLIIALILTMLPMPEWTNWLRPAWVLLVLIYWTMMLPLYIGVGSAWAIGLVVDLLQGTLLGEHAFAYTIVIYFVARMHTRLRMFSLLQQGVSIFMFILLYQSALYCVQGFIDALPNTHLYWLSTLSSTLLWPWLSVLLHDYCCWLQVNEVELD